MSSIKSLPFSKNHKRDFLTKSSVGALIGSAFWGLICLILVLLLITLIWFPSSSMTWIDYSGQFTETSVLNTDTDFSLSRLLGFGLFLTGSALPALLCIFGFYAACRSYQYFWRLPRIYTEKAFVTIVAAFWILISYSAFFTSYQAGYHVDKTDLSMGLIGFETVSTLNYFLRFWNTEYSVIVILISMYFSTLWLFRCSPLYISEWIGSIIDVSYHFYAQSSPSSSRSFIDSMKILRKNIKVELDKLSVLYQSKDAFSQSFLPHHRSSDTHTIASSSSLCVTPAAVRKTVPISTSVQASSPPSNHIHNIANRTMIYRHHNNHNRTNLCQTSSSKLHSSLPSQLLIQNNTKNQPRSDFNTSGVLTTSHPCETLLENATKLSESDLRNSIQNSSCLSQTNTSLHQNKTLEQTHILSSDKKQKTVKTLIVNSADLSQKHHKAQTNTPVNTHRLPTANQSCQPSTSVQNESLIHNDATATPHYDLDEYLPPISSEETMGQTIIPTPSVIPESIDAAITRVTPNHIDTTPCGTPKPSFEAWKNFPLPPISLLDTTPTEGDPPNDELIHTTSQKIEAALKSFGVLVEVKAAYPGPVITRYDIELASGIKGVQIVNLSKDLARSLAVNSIRVVENIPGKPWMGLEVPNAQRQQVKLSETLYSESFLHENGPLSMAIGKDISGNPVTLNLIKMPHLLVAGTTGSGKSVGLNSMILSMLYKASPSQVRLVMIDPKMVELSVYADIPHLIAPVITDMHQAIGALNWCVQEMEHREQLLSKLGVRNIAAFNHKLKEAQKHGKPIRNPIAIEALKLEGNDDTSSVPYLTPLSYLVIVVDEYADLFMVIGKKVEEVIARLAQKGRAGGVHLILATQRPSVDVVTGLIKANVPARIAFQVSTKIDSRTILDQQGAEALLGQGDMLYYRPGQPLRRLHGAYVTDEEVNAVADYLRSVCEPQYLVRTFEESTGDNVRENSHSQNTNDEYDAAIQVVIESNNASISSLQRRLNIGFNKAAKLIERMEKEGIVSTPQKNGKREVLAPQRL